MTAIYSQMPPVFQRPQMQQQPAASSSANQQMASIFGSGAKIEKLQLLKNFDVDL